MTCLACSDFRKALEVRWLHMVSSNPGLSMIKALQSHSIADFEYLSDITGWICEVLRYSIAHRNAVATAEIKANYVQCEVFVNTWGVKLCELLD